MKNDKNNKNESQRKKFKPGFKKRENKCVINFNEDDRQEYLTGFHKRKVERRKAAVEEIKRKIKEEQSRVREERHKEYVKMLKERREALEEAEDDLENAVISKTESIQYDHPNHTVTVTTISDLDLSGTHLLGPVDGGMEEEEEEQTHTMPKKARDPIASRRHPDQMPKPPQLTPFDPEEQRFYSESLPNVRAPHPISKAEPGHPTEETHFGRLYPRSRSFGHYPKLMTIGEDWDVDRPVNREPGFLAQLPLPHDRSAQRPHHCRRRTNPPVDLPIPPTLTREQDPEILKLLHLR
uniref:Nucleolar protein 12 n=1 Tax=Nothobranchius furzeri TaxID=105023 RepID=A0A8C6LZV4_NOTFU